MADSSGFVEFSTLATADNKCIGIAVLTNPKTINAVNMSMAQALYTKLVDWQDDPRVVCVILRGSGDRGFCSGGDVVSLYHSAVDGDDRGDAFFTQEYRLNYFIHVYPKPVICWGHGIVMGGGLGLMAGSSHRVVTQTSRLAMPEVGIGLFPDVGASWFFNRMPGQIGLFMGLTGAAINASDALFVGLADAYLNHSQWAVMLDRLVHDDWCRDHHDVVSQILMSLSSTAVDQPESVLRNQYDTIQEFFATTDHAQVVDNITQYSGDDPWLKNAANGLLKGCPTTIKLVFAQLQAGMHLSLKEVFQMELIMAVNCLRKGNFVEGVRALLIDKDKQPNYSPSELSAVTDESVLSHFEAPWQGPNPLADL